MIIDEWTGCYKAKWRGVNMRHPAKFSPLLIERIYRHAYAEGWISAGDNVLDVFAGVACGAHEAMLRGLNWTGIELEAHFHERGAANIQYWTAQYAGKLPNYGTARILQGDSRDLLTLLEKNWRGTAAMKSPPFQKSLSFDAVSPEDRVQLARKLGESNAEHISPVDYKNHGLDIQDYGETPGQLSNMPIGTIRAAISSPPYARSLEKPNGIDVSKLRDLRHTFGPNSQAVNDPRYGSSDGQLGAMREGKFDAAVSSPPYAGNDKRDFTKETRDDQEQGDGCFRSTYSRTDGQLGDMPTGDIDIAVSSPPYADRSAAPTHVQGEDAGALTMNEGDTYGETDGQLGAMPAGSFDAAVSSPPFLQSSGGTNQTHSEGPLADSRLLARHAAGNKSAHAYGQSDGQLSNLPEESKERETFWSGSRKVVEQLYQALAPGAHAVWVVKSYVKKGKRVPFPEQWRELCESVGFVTLHEHHAMLVEKRGASLTLDGEMIEHVVERKSFFRRLVEEKGAPPIDWEVIYCMVKPEGD